MNAIVTYLFSFLMSVMLSHSVATHSVHISFTEANIKQNYVEGKINFYRDDFFKALKKFNGGNLNGLSLVEYEKLKYDYLQKNFKVMVNTKRYLNLQIINNSEDEYSIWFNFIFTSSEEIKSVKLICKTLFELYDDQMNMFMLKYNNKEQSVVFQKSESVFEIII
ncbi:MAG TPA: hypothetical protein PKA80_01780 [Ignavibacteriaceae bacterium]|nr:hypothetical protein [Ignavibacteriaceae bacterium]